MSDGRVSYEEFVASTAIDSVGGSEKILLSDDGTTKYVTPTLLKTFVDTSRPYKIVGPSGTGADYTYDGTSIHTAINAACLAVNTAGGGNVYILNNGTSSYANTSSIIPRSNVDVIGMGYGTHIVLNANTIFLFDAMSNCGVRNLRLSSPNHSGNHRNLVVKNSTNITIDRCFITSAKAFGIFIEATGVLSCDGVFITRTYVQGLANADAIGGGPTSATSSVKNVFIDKCIVTQDTAQSGSGAYKNAIDIVASDSMKITDSEINGNIVAGFEGDPKNGYSIRGNTVNPALTTGGAFTGTGCIIIQANDELTGVDKNFDISHNTIEEGNIAVIGTAGAAINNVTIDTNTIKTIGAGTFTNGFELEYVNNATMTGNITQGAGAGDAAIDLTNCTYININGNVLYDNETGIRDNSSSNTNSAVGNTFHGNTSNFSGWNGTCGLNNGHSGVQTKTTTYTIVTSDSLIKANPTGGAFTVTLPDDPPSDYSVMVVKNDASANAVTVSGNSNVINGVTSVALTTTYQSAVFQYDGSNWLIKASSLVTTQTELGKEVSRQQSVASNDDVTEVVYQNKVTTTDATVTTLATIPIPASTTVMIEARVVARRTGGSAGSAEDSAAYVIATSYKNVAGTATEVGETAVYSAEDQAGWACAFSASSANALLRVTGAVDNNVSWVVTYRVYAVGS